MADKECNHSPLDIEVALDWRDAEGLCPLCLKERVERLKQDLVDFGRHSEGCSYPYGKEYGCKCGWLEVERVLKER